MKKILAWLLTAALLLGICGAMAEETAPAETAGKYDRLRVAVTTPFSGNFLSAALGNNSSDLDVRRLIHGYNLVNWDSATGAYQFNERLVRAATTNESNMSFVFALSRGLTYNDGTPITARDYAFSLLFLGSRELEEAAGGRESLSSVLGGEDYQSGTAKTLKGVRILGDYQFALEVDPAYMPYFYELKMLQVSPLPISVIAPGCEVKDDGDGVYISGPYTADLLRETLLGENGYISHPAVTSGPYMLTAFDGSTRVEMALNPAYIGDQNGNVPDIPRIDFRAVAPESIMTGLAEGETDLVVRRSRLDQITSGMGLAAGGDFAMKAYSRSGLSFISFCAEKGPTASENVRKAISLCLEKDKTTEAYTGAFGTPVKGYYGIGQWMFMMANGTLVPEEGQEEEWADLNLDGLPVYPLDPAHAGELLEADGWTMGSDGVRHKTIDGADTALTLKMIYPIGNDLEPVLQETFVPHLAEAGIRLETEALEMQELLKRYYRQTERDCDLILLGTDLGDVFDPTGEYDEKGTNRLSGITDGSLRDLALKMRSTEPGNATEYCRRWLRYQERLMNIAAVLPLYSDAYLDFHVNELQNYDPAPTGNWTIAVLDAFLGDYQPEAAAESAEDAEEGDEFTE